MLRGSPGPALDGFEDTVLKRAEVEGLPVAAKVECAASACEGGVESNEAQGAIDDALSDGGLVVHGRTSGGIVAMDAKMPSRRDGLNSQMGMSTNVLTN